MLSDSPASPDDLLSDLPPDPPPVSQYAARDFALPSKNSLWIMGLAVIGVLVGAVWLFQHASQSFSKAASSFKKSTALAYDAATESIMDKDSAPATQNLPQPAGTRTDPATKTPTVPLVELMNSAPNIPREPITMQRFLEDPSIVQLQEKVAQLDLSVATLNETLDTQKKTLEEQLSTLTAKWQAFQKAQAAAVAPVVRAKAPDSSNKAGALPKSSGRADTSDASRLALPKIQVPFELVSIDQWGDATEVVVRYQGNLTRLTADQSLGHWRLARVDAAGKSITVVNAQGQSALLTQP